MSEQNKSLLAIKLQQKITSEQRKHILEAVTPVAKSMGMKPLVLDGGIDVGIHSDIKPLIERQLVLQQQTNELLLMLVDAIAGDEDEAGDEAMPPVYLDGSAG